MKISSDYDYNPHHYQFPRTAPRGFELPVKKPAIDVIWVVNGALASGLIGFLTCYVLGVI